jgi:nucleoid-associated protein YgaU
MTRESRIGLLIGLVFIFAFGLMLSELTGAGEDPITASLTYEDSAGSDLSMGPSASRRGRAGRTPASRLRNQLHRDGTRREQTPRALESVRGRMHRIENGDTLIGLARRYYGPDGEDQYVRILRANRGVITSPEVLPVGKKILIPLIHRSPAQRRAQEPSAPAQRPTVEYTVVEGDSLTKIARKVLGRDDHETVRKIYEANADVLASPDRLPIGTKLRIPR